MIFGCEDEMYVLKLTIRFNEKISDRTVGKLYFISSVLLVVSLYCKPSNTTHMSRVSSIKLTGRHVSVYRRPSSGPQELQLVICNVICCNVMGSH